MDRWGKRAAGGAVCAALCALLLWGCAAPGESAAAGVLETGAEQEGPLQEAEVLDAYARAQEAYGWFAIGDLPVSGEEVSLEGEHYRRVDHEGIETLKDLEIYLRSLFSAQIVEELLSDGRCREIEGVLYARSGGRGADLYRGQVEVAVQQEGQRRYLVNVTAQVLADDLQTVSGVECFAFPYEQVEGRWVFTSFASVY